MPFSSQAVLRWASELEGRAANPAAKFSETWTYNSRNKGSNQSTNHETHHIIIKRNRQNPCSSIAHLYGRDHTVISQ